MSKMKQLREKAGLSQSELAERCEVSRSMISAIECGSREPSLAIIGQLATALGVGTRKVSNAVMSDRGM